MSRPLQACALRALLPLILVSAAGCQDYNFNPVGHCLVQPGTERVTLSNLSTADVLFVVDDSGSMAGKQQKLAANFGTFITNLDQTNANRVSHGLEPIDFHLAVTTTSVFWNFPNGSTCSSSCGSATGSLVCCSGTSTPVTQAVKCSGAGASCPAGTACSLGCTKLKGEYFCCAADGSVPASATQPVPCGLPGAVCGGLEHHYDFSGCTGQGSPVGLAVDQYPYPRGDFVSYGSNPRVLHFDKQLYPATPPATGVPTNRQGFTRQELIDAFAGVPDATGTRVGGNVLVGTCGSGQEQGLQGGRLGVQKALAKQQMDTYQMAPGKIAAWDPTNRIASAPAEWPHDNSKLVVVFVGDEDDCSSPDDPSAGIVMVQFVTGADSCVADSALPLAQQREFQVQSFVDYFTGLGRPLGAAFIESAAQTSCGLPGAPACTPGVCCQADCPYGNQCTTTPPSFYTSPQYCGGQAPGKRFFTAASAFQAAGADVVEGSVCDSFGVILNQVAEIVKPPSVLTLKTQPAEGSITLLRIADTNGQTRKICTGPAPAGTAGAALSGYDWWFTATSTPTSATLTPVAVSQFVYINHDAGRCEANPGETYSADYIALTPAGGCTTKADCSRALGGATTDWGCYVPPGTGRGTCICCAPGSTDPSCQ